MISQHEEYLANVEEGAFLAKGSEERLSSIVSYTVSSFYNLINQVEDVTLFYNNVTDQKYNVMGYDVMALSSIQHA